MPSNSALLCIHIESRIFLYILSGADCHIELFQAKTGKLVFQLHLRECRLIYLRVFLLVCLVYTPTSLVNVVKNSRSHRQNHGSLRIRFKQMNNTGLIWSRPCICKPELLMAKAKYCINERARSTVVIQNRLWITIFMLRSQKYGTILK